MQPEWSVMMKNAKKTNAGMGASEKAAAGGGNVFADLGFSSGRAEYLLRRVDLMIEVEKWFMKSGLTQSAAAKLLGVTQPRFNQLLKGKTEIFSIDALVTMLAHAGMKVRMTVRKAA